MSRKDRCASLPSEKARKTDVLVKFVMCSVPQSCLTLSDTMDCSPPASSVRGISQARMLEWAVISFSRGSSRPRDRTRVSCISCAAGRFFTAVPPVKSSEQLVSQYQDTNYKGLLCMPVLWAMERGTPSQTSPDSPFRLTVFIMHSLLLGTC